MRVLVITGIFPPDAGGPATYVPLMTASLVSRGHTVSVITLSPGSYDDASRGYPVHRIRRDQSKPVRVVKTIFSIRKVASTSDIVFVNGLQFESALATWLRRPPMVIKVVGDLAWEQAQNRGWVTDGFDDFQQRSYGWKVGLLRWIRNWPLRRARRVISNSHYMADQIESWGVDRTKIQVVHNSSSRLEVEPISLFTDRDPLVVSVGRFVSWKGFSELIESMRTVPEARLILVGDGPLRGELENQVAQSGLHDRVIFAGRRPHEETLGLMAAADIFVLNSDWESFPHVVLEAMELGLPVIATATGGTKEIVDHDVNGLLVEPRSGHLPTVLQELVRDPNRRERLAAAGRKKSRSLFAEHQMIDETESVLMNAH